MARSEKDKMLAGELYLASDPEIQREQAAAAEWLACYNASWWNGSPVWATASKSGRRSSATTASISASPAPSSRQTFQAMRRSPAIPRVISR